MSRRWVGGDSADVIDIGAGADIADLRQYTIVHWRWMEYLDSLDFIFAKSGAGVSHNFRMGNTGFEDQVFAVVTRATTNTVYETNNANLDPGRYWFVAIAVDLNAGSNQMRIFRGDQNTPATECTYGTATDGSGTPTDNTPYVGRIGNDTTAANSDASKRIAHFAILPGQLTEYEVRRVQFEGELAGRAIRWYPLGRDTPEPDIAGSGVHGIVSGPTYSDPFPVLRRKGRMPARRLAPLLAGPQIVAVGLASETDSALPVLPARSYPVGLAAETDTALAFTPAKRVSVGQAQEADTALSVTAAKAREIGPAAEVDAALPVAARKTMAVGVAAEADTALPVSTGAGIPVGQATEADTALPIAPRKSVAVGIASEADTVLVITVRKIVAVGQATETDAAIGVAPGKSLLLGIATGTEAALPTFPRKLMVLGSASEADTALAVAAMGGAPPIAIILTREATLTTGALRSAVLTAPGSRDAEVTTPGQRSATLIAAS